MPAGTAMAQAIIKPSATRSILISEFSTMLPRLKILSNGVKNQTKTSPTVGRINALSIIKAAISHTPNSARGSISFIYHFIGLSCIYIFNDLNDVIKDRLHPKKSKRPIASGEVSENTAKVLLVVLLILGIVFNWLCFNIYSTIVLASYILFNVFYSQGLKNIPIVDVAILVSGFLLRIIYGAIITNISISHWLYLTVMAISFFFALGKRRNELKQIKDEDTRSVLKLYPLNFLDKNMYMCLGLANMFYALWTMDTNTIASYGTDNIVYTVPLVLLITMKYSFDVEKDTDGDPVEVLISDKILIGLCLIYGITMFILLYL